LKNNDGNAERSKYLGQVVFERCGIEEAVLMHNPVSSGAMGRLSSIENQSLLHPNDKRWGWGGVCSSNVGENGLVFAGGFPIARKSGPV